MNTFAAEALTGAMRQLIPEVVARVRPASHHTNRILWRELSCCVLSSQVPYEIARIAAQKLDRVGTLHAPTRKARGDLVRAINRVLSTPFRTTSGLRRYRFASSRARQLASAWRVIQGSYGTLKELLAAMEDPVQLRLFLVKSVSGIGPKQASMFLRNVGLSYDFAVIDTHVSMFMLRTGLCEDLPSGLQYLPVYERYEEILRREAVTIGFPVGIIDWAIWFVMRAAKELEREWRL